MTDLKCIIAGSRGVTDYNMVVEALSKCEWSDRIVEIVSGTAKGVDQLGERYAEENGLEIAKFPADWSLGRAAGHIRNKDMAKYADFAIIIMVSGGSAGSKNMIEQMVKLKKPHMVFEVIGDKLCQTKLRN